MTPVKTSGVKKDELIQFRIDKRSLDRLNTMADKKEMPLSTMLRLWISDRLRDETQIENKSRDEWRKRQLQILQARQDFVDGPLLLVQVLPFGKVKLDMEKLRERWGALVPVCAHRRNVEPTTHQHGLEVTVYTGSGRDKAVAAQGQAFKTGEVQTILQLPTKDKQIYGYQMDFAIVVAIHDLCSILHGQGIDMPYIVHVSLLRTKDYSPVDRIVLASSQELPKFTADRIDVATDIVVTDLAQIADIERTGEFLLDALDEVWHASGQRCSKSFDPNNKWVNPVRQ